MSIYRTIFRNAYKITWHNPFLWFFGLFAALVGSGGELTQVFDNWPKGAGSDVILNPLEQTIYQPGFSSNIAENFNKAFANLGWAGLASIVLLILIAIFLLWLSIVSQAGLFNSTYKLSQNEKTDFSSAFALGRKKFWPVLGLNIITGLFTLINWLIIGLPLIYLSTSNNLLQIILFVVAFVVMVPLATIISFVIKYSVLYATCQDQSFGQSLSKAWKLFKANWLISIEMAITLLVASIILVIFALIGFGLIMIPFSLIVAVFWTMKSGQLIFITLLVAFLLLLVLLLWVGAMWSSFRHASWAILFSHINQGKVHAKIARVFQRKDKKT